MLTVYGTNLCRDCVACREAYDRAGIAYRFLEFEDSLENLKAFLRLRDSLALFDEIKAAGRVGIPCVVDENGEATLDWRRFL